MSILKSTTLLSNGYMKKEIYCKELNRHLKKPKKGRTTPLFLSVCEEAPER